MNIVCVKKNSSLFFVEVFLGMAFTKAHIINMLKNSIVIVVVFIVSGCVGDLKFNPKKLPDGYVGKSYFTEVNISGGTGPVVDLNYEFQPDDPGLVLCFSHPGYYTNHIYNKFTIKGIPNVEGGIKLTLKGGIVASGGCYFEKIYIINVLK